MTTDTRTKILDYIKTHNQARVHELQQFLKLSHVAVHKQLRKLLEEGIITRVGKPPLVFYTLPSEVFAIGAYETKDLEVATKQIIGNNFLSITPDGRLLYGIDGFVYWMRIYQKNKSVGIVAQEYAETWKKQRKMFTRGGWIEASLKLKNSFKETPISHLLFADIYSYPVFGRTKLAKLVMYAKQTSEKKLIDKVSEMVKPIVENIINSFSIEAVAFIPPTVPRPLQFMDELESKLQLILPKIELVKAIPGDIPIPQKTLTSLQERIINARDSIYLKTNTKLPYKKILLIDDVVGSGASFNETAKKIYNNSPNINIIAFGLVGNIKGYDVIRET